VHEGEDQSDLLLVALRQLTTGRSATTWNRSSRRRMKQSSTLPGLRANQSMC
jgi:hypothetical protein